MLLWGGCFAGFYCLYYFVMALFTDIDFRKLAYDLTPHFLRKPKYLAFVYTFMQTLKQTNLTFNSFRTFTNYCLSFTGQVIYLEEWLNQQYDPVARGIVIVDTSNQVYTYIRRKIEARPPLYLYRKSEAQPPRYLKRISEFQTFSFFTIQIPASVIFNEDILRSQLKKWVLLSKNYTIQIV